MFRGKSLDTGEWVYGYLFIQAPGTEYEAVYIICDLDHRESIYDIWKCAVKVDPTTVGQYTGRNDVSGVKVFTDDIIKYQMPGPYSGPEYRINKVGPVIFSDYCFMPLTFRIADSVKVIGNIHDNPELHMKK